MIHRLKCWAENFDAIAAGRKTCEVRHEDDRQFRRGDTLELTRTTRKGEPTVPLTRIVVQVTHVDRDAGELEIYASEPGGGGLRARPAAVLSLRGPMTLAADEEVRS